MSPALQIRVPGPNSAGPARRGGPGPYRLTGMLLDGVRERVAAARDHIESGNHSGKHVILQSALLLLGELRADLDLFNGGAIAAHLDDLYDYMARRLRAAGLENAIAALDEVSHLLEALRSAWAFMPAEARSAARTEPARQEAGKRAVDRSASALPFCPRAVKAGGRAR